MVFGFFDVGLERVGDVEAEKLLGIAGHFFEGCEMELVVEADAGDHEFGKLAAMGFDEGEEERVIAEGDAALFQFILHVVLEMPLQDVLAFAEELRSARAMISAVGPSAVGRSPSGRSLFGDPGSVM